MNWQEMRIWAGRGTGDSCARCREPIDASEMQYEVELRMDAFAAQYQPALRFHLRCLDQWRRELE